MSGTVKSKPVESRRVKEEESGSTRWVEPVKRPPHRSVSLRGYFVDGEVLTKGEKRQIRKELTVSPLQQMPQPSYGNPPRYTIYKQTAYGYYVPRFYGYQKFGLAKSTSLKEEQKVYFRLKEGVSPKEKQKPSLAKLGEIFRAENRRGDGGILSLPCGWGKTFCAIWAMSKLGLKTLILVGKEFLAEQWSEAIANFLTLENGEEVTVGRIQGKKFQTEHPVVIGMIQTVSLRQYNPKHFRDFGFLVIDECHHMSSAVFCKALQTCQLRFTLGLSATPERKDGLSYVFHHFLGPLIHKEERTLENRVTVIQPQLKSVSDYYKNIYDRRGNVSTVAIASALVLCRRRNQLILSILKEIFNHSDETEPRKVLLLSNRRDHLHQLKEMLDSDTPQLNGRPITYGFYYGAQNMGKREHREMLQESVKRDLLLGTDSIAKEGLDIPELNTLFLSTPAGYDVEQPVGRIQRKIHDTNPLVIDLVDHVGNFKRHGGKRGTWYRKQCYRVIKRDINLDETVEAKGILEEPDAGKTRRNKGDEETNAEGKVESTAPLLIDV